MKRILIITLATVTLLVGCNKENKKAENIDEVDMPFIDVALHQSLGNNEKLLIEQQKINKEILGTDEEIDEYIEPEENLEDYLNQEETTELADISTEELGVETRELLNYVKSIILGEVTYKDIQEGLFKDKVYINKLTSFYKTEYGSDVETEILILRDEKQLDELIAAVKRSLVKIEMEGDGAGIVTEIMPTPKDQYIIDTLGPKVKESINPKYREYTDAEYPQTYLRYLIDCETGEEEYCNDLDSRVYERDNNLYINKNALNITDNVGIIADFVSYKGIEISFTEEDKEGIPEYSRQSDPQYEGLRITELKSDNERVFARIENKDFTLSYKVGVELNTDRKPEDINIVREK